MKKIVALLLICFTLLLSNICITNAAIDTVDYSTFGINFKLPTYYRELESLRTDNTITFCATDDKTIFYIIEDSIGLDKREFDNWSLLAIWYRFNSIDDTVIDERDIKRNDFNSLESVIFHHKYTPDENKAQYMTTVAVWKPSDGHTVYFMIGQEYDCVNMSFQYDFYDIIRSITFDNPDQIFVKPDNDVRNYLIESLREIETNYSINYQKPSFFDYEIDRIKTAVDELK